MPQIEAVNVTAQFAYRARGNPPSTQPLSAISNCFPGLEFDFRNVWKNLFEGVELHEAGQTDDGHIAMHIEPSTPAAAAGVGVFDRLIEVDGRRIETRYTLPGQSTNFQIAWEFANSLSHILKKTGSAVPCVFQKASGQRVTANLVVHALFDGAAIHPDLAEPGALTQSLCSPWQADYRECGCYYWAASRPDFVNVDNVGGNAQGHDWMQANRSPGQPYRPDAGGFSPNHVLYDQLYSEWERHLRFVFDGRTEEAGTT